MAETLRGIIRGFARNAMSANWATFSASTNLGIHRKFVAVQLMTTEIVLMFERPILSSPVKLQN